MKITPTPCRMDATLSASVDGDTLTLNGLAVDLAGVEEGATVDAETFACDWITGPVTREGGVLHLTLILPLGPDAPQEALWPEPIEAGDGPVALPGQQPAEGQT